MQIKQIPINEIKEYPDNNRDSRKTVKILVNLIKEFGFNVPIVVDKDYVIVKGHSRYLAAKQLGMETIPSIISENDDERNKEDRILDNKISELTKWDLAKLSYELDEVGLALKELGMPISIGEPLTTDITQEDIELAEDKMVIKDKNYDEVHAMMTFTCPECGGFFEHKIIDD